MRDDVVLYIRIPADMKTKLDALTTTAGDTLTHVARAILSRGMDAYARDSLPDPKPENVEDLDLVTAILRIRQAYSDETIRDFLVYRLATCDVPRLMSRLSVDDQRIIDIMERD